MADSDDDVGADQPSEIRAVLDTTAVLSYSRGHVHVGELLVDIADEGAYIGLPTVVLLDAHARLLANGPARARLGVLVTLPGIAILSLDVDEAAAVASIVPRVARDFARAHAIWAALQYGAYYLSSEPAPPLLSADQVHHIPAEDA